MWRQKRRGLTDLEVAARPCCTELTDLVSVKRPDRGLRMASSAPTSEVVDLVQQLIRNECVNDGTPGSGGEVRNADLLEAYLAGSGLDVQRFDSAPGRSNLIARIEGTDPEAPTLCLLGHTDVVPVNEARWSEDPFGGEIIDGCVWGRGAIDMFNLTASMAVAMKTFAKSGFRPRGNLIYAAVADEEAGGEYGARFLAEREPDAVACDFLVTESGGFPMPSPEGVRLPYLHEEKGPLWASMKVHGAPCHGSMPFRADNALVKAAEVVRRIASYRPPSRLDESWRAFVAGLGLPAELRAPLLREEGFVETIEMLPLGLSKLAYSSTHTTITPTMLTAGSKVNIIPDEVDIALDIRVLPGDDADSVRGMIAEALGDLAGRGRGEVPEAGRPRNPVTRVGSVRRRHPSCGADVLPRRRARPDAHGGHDRRPPLQTEVRNCGLWLRHVEHSPRDGRPRHDGPRRQ